MGAPRLIVDHRAEAQRIQARALTHHLALVLTRALDRELIPRLGLIRGAPELTRVLIQAPERIPVLIPARTRERTREPIRELIRVLIREPTLGLMILQLHPLAKRLSPLIRSKLKFVQQLPVWTHTVPHTIRHQSRSRLTYAQLLTIWQMYWMIKAIIRAQLSTTSHSSIHCPRAKIYTRASSPATRQKPFRSTCSRRLTCGKTRINGGRTVMSLVVLLAAHRAQTATRQLATCVVIIRNTSGRRRLTYATRTRLDLMAGSILSRVTSHGAIFSSSTRLMSPRARKNKFHPYRL